MIEFTTDIRPSMAIEMRASAGQKGEAPLTPDNLFRLINSGPAWGVRLDGKLIALGGHTPIWPGRTVVWGYLAEDCGPALRAMTREVRRQCEALAVEFPRIEAYAARHHENGSQWLKLLGFRREGLMRKFYGDGDYFLFARVQ